MIATMRSGRYRQHTWSTRHLHFMFTTLWSFWKIAVCQTWPKPSWASKNLTDTLRWQWNCRMFLVYLGLTQARPEYFRFNPVQSVGLHSLLPVLLGKEGVKIVWGTQAITWVMLAGKSVPCKLSAKSAGIRYFHVPAPKRVQIQPHPASRPRATTKEALPNANQQQTEKLSKPCTPKKDGDFNQVGTRKLSLMAYSQEQWSKLQCWEVSRNATGRYGFNAAKQMVSCIYCWNQEGQRWSISTIHSPVAAFRSLTSHAIYRSYTCSQHLW